MDQQRLDDWICTVELDLQRTGTSCSICYQLAEWRDTPVKMRVLLQRVTHGRVSVDGMVVGEIGEGLVLLLGVSDEDGKVDVVKLAQKVANLRIFSDADGKFNLSLLDVGGAALVISQFTLYADTRRGRRPSFTMAARPDHAEPLVDFFVERLRAEGVEQVETGVFGAMMMVEIFNDGPVTIWLDSAEL